MPPKVLVLRAAGTNCDAETAHAFRLAGAEPAILHVNRLREQPSMFDGFQVLAIPGGFSYGDDVASGRVFANELMSVLRTELLRFIDRGGYCIGICNGFQVLVKAGLLPRLAGETRQVATLTDNLSGMYRDRWVRVVGDPTRCAWIPDGAEIDLPVAHGEGRFVAPAGTIESLGRAHQIALRYAGGTNPNGSQADIAGICDPTGRVFGLMPHPERFLRRHNHPRWTRQDPGHATGEGAGVRFFRTAIDHLKRSA